MDQFSIPERMEPVAHTENNRRNSVYPDRHRRRPANPATPAVRSEDSDPQGGEDSGLDDEIHNLDEQA